jgi:hypothetical protein
VDVSVFHSHCHRAARHGYFGFCRRWYFAHDLPTVAKRTRIWPFILSERRARFIFFAGIFPPKRARISRPNNPGCLLIRSKRNWFRIVMAFRFLLIRGLAFRRPLTALLRCARRFPCHRSPSFCTCAGLCTISLFSIAAVPACVPKVPDRPRPAGIAAAFPHW